MAIKFYSYKGDTVLDPFAGSFTTSLVAIKNGSNSIGIDITPEYVKLGEKRLKDYLKQTRLSDNGKPEIMTLNKNDVDKIKIDSSKVFNKESYINNKPHKD